MEYVILWYQWDMRYYGINGTYYIMVSMGRDIMVSMRNVISWYQWDM